VEDIGECYLLDGPTRKGYVRLRVGSSREGGAYKDHSAHRVAWMAVNGPIPDGGQILHHCDNRACIRASHLYLGTNDDNVRDRVMRMRSARKLTDEEVAEIRSLYGERGVGGVSGEDLARQYGVSKSLISRIIHRKASRAAG
jgi:hypothetical protein